MRRKLGGYDNISTLRLENVSDAFDKKAILESIPAGSRVRVTGLNWTADSAEEILAFYDTLDTMRGLDENGNNVQKAQVSGVCIIETLTGNELAEMRERYPNIEIQYKSFHSNIYFYDASGENLLQTVTVMDGKDAVYNGATPTKEATAKYTYSFSGWSFTPGGSKDSSALKAVTKDRNVYAAFTGTIRTYNVYFYNGNTVVQKNENVKYGTYVTYTGAALTKADALKPEDWEFTGWSPSVGSIVGHTYYYAQYKYVGYDSKFAYSHHATDPACGKLLNAFDMVRLHLFRDLDEKASLDTPVGKLPSFTAMRELALKDERVKSVFAEERMTQASAEFDNEDWQTQLELDRSGGVKDTLTNICIILRHDPNLQNIVFNQFKSMLDVTGDLPWPQVKPG